MTRVDRACVLATLVVAAVLHPMSAARAQSADAEALFRAGRDLIKRGQVAAGCEKLAASERLESSVGTLLNLGDCRERLGRLASAWAAFRKAEAMARRSGDDDKRQAEAGRRAAQLEPRLSRLVIEVPQRVDGLVVRRDGEVVDRAAWSMALPVDPGSYAIRAEAPGREAWRSTVSVGDGAMRRVVVVPALRPAPVAAPRAAVIAAPAPVVLAPVARGTWTTTRTFSVWIGLAGAGALGTGAYFGVHANDLQDRADRRCPLAQCSDPEGLRLNDDAQRSASRANVLYVTGGAALATAVVLWFVGAPGETVVVPTSNGREHGVAITGRF